MIGCRKLAQYHETPNTGIVVTISHFLSVITSFIISDYSQCEAAILPVPPTCAFPEQRPVPRPVFAAAAAAECGNGLPQWL